MNEKIVFMSALQELTEKQRQALELAATKWRKIEVYWRSFGLPEGYISLTLISNDGHIIIGGMSPEGEIST